MKNIVKKQAPFISSLLISSILIGCSTNSANTPSELGKIKTQQKLPVTLVSTTPPQPHKPQVADQTENPHIISTENDHLPSHQKLEEAQFAAKKQFDSKRQMQKHNREKTMLYAPSPVYQGIQPFASNHNNIQDNEKYAHYESNRVIQTLTEPVSTFSMDVDTGSYSNIRRLINSGNLPVKDAVRAEEMINYFNYDVSSSNQQDAPFSINTEVGPSPWSSDRHLMKISIKAMDTEQQALPAANLVFLIDVSGSMQSADKLGLLKKSLSLLISKLRQEDSIAIVVYASASGVILEPTSGNNKEVVLRALDSLTASGSTNGASGIRLAYQVAQQAYIKNGINRILLATDGDFNVGTVNFEQLKNLVEEKRKTGISLSTIGFGSGNYNDHLMEQLADAANGKYSYIDNLNEAQKVLVNEMSSSLKTVAKDGKIQIEFNPDMISEYRLIGYENRKLNKEDFNNDKVDAGDIGAGDSVTALYEVVLKQNDSDQIDPLRYGSHLLSKKTSSVHNELAFVKIRFKNPGQDHSQLVSLAIEKNQIQGNIDNNSTDFRFAVSVAGFAELLKGGKHQRAFEFDQVISLANSAKGDDTFGYRHEFIQLVRLAKTLQSGSFASTD